MQIERLGQVAINVKDVPRATAFYRDTLGLTFLFAPGPNLAFFDAGGVRLMLTRPENPEFDHPASILYYKVADLEGSWAELQAKGVNLTDAPHLVAPMPDHDLWMAGLKDSEGNTVVLMCEKRKAG
jgi:methylmalonyl-CoA/ethylmalonyl-CoA epimerase